MAGVEVKDFSSNKQLETLTNEFKKSNEFDNYNSIELLNCILMELKKVTKELKKING